MNLDMTSNFVRNADNSLNYYHQRFELNFFLKYLLYLEYLLCFMIFVNFLFDGHQYHIVIGDAIYRVSTAHVATVPKTNANATAALTITASKRVGVHNFK